LMVSVGLLCTYRVVSVKFCKLVGY
jgi:hypothetical protein